MSHPKSRTLDMQFIELFDLGQVPWDPAWVPRSWPELRGDPLLLLGPAGHSAAVGSGGAVDAESESARQGTAVVSQAG
jgi:hypothetical protein